MQHKKPPNVMIVYSYIMPEPKHPQNAKNESLNLTQFKYFPILHGPHNAMHSLSNSYPQDQDAVVPPQLGIVTPGFRFRLTSISPHLSSHSSPGVSNWIFHGSSKASNQK